MREAWLTRGPSGIDGIISTWKSDTGFICDTVERQDLNNSPDISRIPKGRYLCLWQWSEKHGCYLYHLQEVQGRSAIEIHSANVFEQLLGCLAPGSARAMFKKNSIRPGVPSRDMEGVINSVATLELLHRDLWDGQKQVPFYLNIV